MNDSSIIADLPGLYQVRQVFARPQEPDPAGAVVRELLALGVRERIRAGQRIAITAGSRGIANIALMLRSAADFVRSCGGEPFVVAAMGSHGGGTVAGQISVLESFGITENSVGAPIVAGTGDDTLMLGLSKSGQPVYFDRSAAAADGIIVVNRIKAHTTFTAPNESGLLKMLVVGLGKEKGAQLFHSLGQAELPRLLPEMADVSLAKMPILAGIALLENAYEETAVVKGIAPANFQAGEAELLRVSASLMPRLPSDDIDLLIVDEMGKNYSGTGMDTKIIGRMRLDRVPEPERPRVKKIVVLGLSEESHGNANGLNLADVVTQRLVSRVDFPNSYANCVATTFIQRIACPMTMDSDLEAVAIAVRSLGPLAAPGDLRVVRIKNTLHLDEVWVSPSVLAVMARETPDGHQVLDGPLPLTFDATGLLLKGHPPVGAL